MGAMGYFEPVVQPAPIVRHVCIYMVSGHAQRVAKGQTLQGLSAVLLVHLRPINTCCQPMAVLSMGVQSHTDMVFSEAA